MLSARFNCLFNSVVAFGLLAGCASSSSPGGSSGSSPSQGGGGTGSSQASTSGSSGPTSGSTVTGTGSSVGGTGMTAAGGSGSGATPPASGTSSTGSPATTTGSGSGASTSGAGATAGSTVTGTPGAYKTVEVIESSKAGGAGMMPEHCATLAPLTPGAVATAPAGTTTITVDPTKTRQTINGFGAAMTEVVASTISLLTQAQQTQIYGDLFSTTGSNYTLTRTHIGSCDFALSAYTFDDNGGKADPTLANFSIKQDMDYLIPGLKAALAASNNTLKILGSMWTAPPWMSNPPIYNGGIVQAQYYPALAKYFSMYAQAYKAAGVPVWAITPANEPLGVGGARESMVWNDTQMNTFIGTDLGPQFMKDGVTTKIFIYDHNKGSGPNTDELVWTKLMFGDATTKPFLQGTALHWYNSTYEVYEQTLDNLHAIPGSGDLLFDEGTADGFIFGGAHNNGQTISAAGQIAAAWQNDSWFWDNSEYDWGWNYSGSEDHILYPPVSRYARDIIVGLNHWYTGWIDWNAVLNKWGAQAAAGGGNGTAGPLPTQWSPPGTAQPGTRGDPGVSHIQNGNPASIMIDEDPTMPGPQTGTIYYTPIFYVMRHVSKYILPGATVLTVTNSAVPNGDSTVSGPNCSTTNVTPAACAPSQTLYATAAQNTNGTTAVVIFNSGLAAVPYMVTVGTQSVTGSMPAQSIQTLVWQ